MDTATILRSIDDDARALLAAAGLDLGLPVPHCAPWDCRALIRHQGSILSWMSAIVAAGDRVSRRDLPSPPEDGVLPAWYRGQLEQVLAVFAAADPETLTWTFSASGDRRVAWWHRRLAVEVAVHRWDAEHTAAVGGLLDPAVVAPVRGDVAAAGIEEFVVDFLPGLLDQPGAEGIGGTLHLHATDGTSEWWIDLDDGGAARPDHAKADTALRGSRSDLLLWLYNRVPAEPLQVFGPSGVLDGWGHLEF